MLTGEVALQVSRTQLSAFIPPHGCALELCGAPEPSGLGRGVAAEALLNIDKSSRFFFRRGEAEVGLACRKSFFERLAVSSSIRCRMAEGRVGSVSRAVGGSWACSSAKATACNRPSTSEKCTHSSS